MGVRLGFMVLHILFTIWYQHNQLSNTSSTFKVSEQKAESVDVNQVSKYTVWPENSAGI